MTGGQTQLFGPGHDAAAGSDVNMGERLEHLVLAADRPPLVVIRATMEETAAHERMLDLLDQRAERGSLWRREAAGATFGMVPA
jgi:hypothetical protein